jgi:hypothetical protein
MPGIETGQKLEQEDLVNVHAGSPPLTMENPWSSTVAESTKPGSGILELISLRQDNVKYDAV